MKNNIYNMDHTFLPPGKVSDIILFRNIISTNISIIYLFCCVHYIIIVVIIIIIKALFIDGNHFITNHFQWAIIWKGIYKKDSIYTDIYNA